MKYCLFVFIVLFWALLTSAESAKCICRTNLCRVNEAVKAIEIQLRKKASPKAVPPQVLAPAILRASLKYGIDYHVLTAVILVESKGVASAYNRKTQDHGLGQINSKTARAMGLTMTCLYQWKCNLNATAKIISEINDGRLCRYNVGTAPIIYGKLLINCQRYERRIASMQ